MSICPVTLATFSLDPRFHSEHLSDDEWSIASNFTLKAAENLELNRLVVLNEFTDYRPKTGKIFGVPFIWEAVHAPTCAEVPARWWIAYERISSLSKVAEMLLSLLCTAAMIERCNKPYAIQKTKSRNRLLPQYASKLAMVSFNLRIQRSLDTVKPRKKTVGTRNNIVTLSVSSARSRKQHVPVPPIVNSQTQT